jgi:nitrate reductase (cytochrome)
MALPTEIASDTNQTRREFFETLGGIGLAGAAALGGWRALELLVPPGTAEAWHGSVCRYCGTGCGIRVGMRQGKITDVRGDEDAHNQGVICIKGSMFVALPYLPGRLTRPRIRKDGQLVDATWDEAMTLAADTFRQTIQTHGPDSVAFYGSGHDSARNLTPPTSCLKPAFAPTTSTATRACA